MTGQIIIKRLTTIEELEAMQAVEKAVWDMPTTPLHQTYTALNNGGILLGAYDGTKMIGFLYSFPGFDGKAIYVCSHMLGIIPAYRKSGLGVQMKQKQAEIAKTEGFSYITWTFDPLESKNAFINIHHLQAIGAIYLENHYGDLDDGLNSGLPTDRIQIVWDMKIGEHERMTMDGARLLLAKDVLGKPKRMEQDLLTENVWMVGIPSDFQAIKATNLALAKSWRLESRATFQALFSAGFEAVGYQLDEDQQQGYYIFRK